MSRLDGFSFVSIQTGPSLEAYIQLVNSLRTNMTDQKKILPFFMGIFKSWHETVH